VCVEEGQLSPSQWDGDMVEKVNVGSVAVCRAPWTESKT